jgi:hypothetical protein
MSVTFKTTKLESNSSLYQAEAIDENGKVIMTWQIACNESDDPNVIASEGYAHSIAPPVILSQGA